MSAWFIRGPHHRKPHVISQGLKSMVGTIYMTACGQFIRYRSDFTDVEISEPGEIQDVEVCGICRRKTKQAIA